MNDGGCHLRESVTNGISEQLSNLSLNDYMIQPISDKLEKNPKLIARQYQIDLCKKALKENVIVYLGTGCGMTHIAVLLIYEMGHLIKKPQKNICVFLAPTVALVQQQAKVIEKSVDFKVGIYCESSAHLKGQRNWEKEIEDYEVLVMTPQILLHNLLHCFITIETIALLIFDECHYAQLESHHPYAEIMKIFYKVDLAKRPRIFGMTTSPKLGKGGSIDSLEALLHAKVYSVDDKDELEQFVTSPKVNVYYYGSIENGYSCPYTLYTRKIEEIKHQCMSELRLNTLDQRLRSSTKKLLQNLHSSIICCLENLGLCGALQASYIFLKGDQNEHIEEIDAGRNCGDDELWKKYLQKTASVLASDCMEDGMEADFSCVEVLREPFMSRKLLLLTEILSTFRLREKMKCIVFVNRIIIARSLSYILRNLKRLTSWKCDFLVGVHSKLVSRKNTNIILEQFRSGELNLLVATKVGEEGLDIQTCCRVIRFDLPETVSSFIQSRGCAQMPQSEYAFLVARGNPRELNLIGHFKKDEAQMNEEISSRKSLTPVAVTGLEERTYKVNITGATMAQGYKSKSKSLEEVLKESEKRKAELIGFDEMTTSNYDLVSSPVRQSHFPRNRCNADPQGTGTPCTGLAKSSLYEICVANCWKPPIFECFKETGPCHLKEFIYKVVVEIEEMPNETFEVYGEPRTRKKDAAEHAAEGALWYLEHKGYLWNKKQYR